MASFDYVEDLDEPKRYATSFINEPPNANSTLLESRSHTNSNSKHSPQSMNLAEESSSKQHSKHSSWASGLHSHDVGHISHIPRVPPSQQTYTIPPSVFEKTTTINIQEEDLFGMIKLKDNDVCYTSGTIEWVGRKRCYPINSGFKLTDLTGHEMTGQKFRKLNKSYSNEVEKLKDCDCADVLPTVNAIVDHLNALHEAVDLVDLRLNTLEDVMSSNEN